mgnify:CR=1 FL=1
MIQAETNTRLVVEMYGNHKFAGLFKLLDEAGVNILSAVLYPAIRGNYSGLALIVDDTEKAIAAFEREHICYKRRPVFALEMGETTFGDTIKKLLDAGYDVEQGLRAFFTVQDGKAWCIYAPTCPKDYNDLVKVLNTFIKTEVAA